MRNMFQEFKESILHVDLRIAKGQYPTYSKLYKELDALEKEFGFAYRHEALSYLEYRKLENAIDNSLQRFCSARLHS